MSWMGGEHPSYNCTLDGDKDNTDVWVSVTDPVLPRDREGAVNFRFKMNSKQQWTPTLRNSVGFKMAVMRVTDEMLMPDSAIDEGGVYYYDMADGGFQGGRRDIFRNYFPFFNRRI